MPQKLPNRVRTWRTDRIDASVCALPQMLTRTKSCDYSIPSLSKSKSDTPSCSWVHLQLPRANRTMFWQMRPVKFETLSRQAMRIAGASESD